MMLDNNKNRIEFPGKSPGSMNFARRRRVVMMVNFYTFPPHNAATLVARSSVPHRHGFEFLIDRMQLNGTPSPVPQKEAVEAGTTTSFWPSPVPQPHHAATKLCIYIE